MVPAPVLTQLQAFFQANTRHMLRLTSELRTLLRLFESHGIMALPYKGPTLAVLAYGNLALRTSSDLDIIVHQDDIATVKTLLLAQGYRWKPRLGHLLRARTGSYVRSSYLYDDGFEKLDSTGRSLFAVEMHWTTTPRHTFFPLPPEHVWHDLSQVSLSGRLVPSLPLETLLPLLCINGAKDHWLMLKAVCDVAALVHTHPSIDWDQARHTAHGLGREKCFFMGLSLAQTLLATPLPAPVTRWVEAEPTVRSMSRRVGQRLLQAQQAPLSILSKVLFNMKLRDSLSDKLRYCWFALIHQADRGLTPLIRRQR